MLPNGQKIRQNLGGMELIGQTVPNGNACVLRQFLYNRLTVATVLNTVIHPAQNPGGVSDRLLLAHLGAARAKVGHSHTQIRTGYLKGAPGTSAVLLKQQDNILALTELMGNSGLLLDLEIRCHVQKIADLGRSQIQQFQKTLVLHITYPPCRQP